MNKNWEDLKSRVDGELHIDSLHTRMYATDASVYREVPDAVFFPKNKKDVQTVIEFASENKLSIVPRAAGTSLAGQVVGTGIVVDCSKHLNKIIEINAEESWVRIEPGVILDELNQALEPHGLFFGPETSTSTHCTVGGMFGNNSCGTHSIIYGSVRQHIIDAEVVLANGEIINFEPQTKSEYLEENGEKGRIQKQIYQLLKHPNIIKKIEDRFPKKSVSRRNTGYALDYLVDTELFIESDKAINICELLAGSEGTLAFTTEMKLNLVPLPPTNKAVVCLQHNSISASAEANLVALKHHPDAVELMDDIIIGLARQNPVQKEQSEFIKGLPKAVLLVEFTAESRSLLQAKIDEFLEDINQTDLSDYSTVLYDDEVAKVWKLRKAGLGVLGNLVGDKKPVALIEDTAVAPELLPQYVNDMAELLHKYDNECVFYAHISVGELHLRPILNLKLKEDRELFRTIGKESAELVAKYGGSISGEHGDGRLRGEFIPIQYGEEMYQLFKKVKEIFDPNNVLNPAKIVDTAPMDEFIRYEENQETTEFDTMYDFSSDLGLLRAAEKCNGIGFCRKTEKIGGTMCPSYQATRDEKDTTRARANILREFLTRPNDKNAFANPEIQEALDLCLSCKACKTECPSGVDMAKLKAEVLYQKHKTEGIPFRSKLIATNTEKIKPVQSLAKLINPIMNLPFVKSMLGFAPKRSMPAIQSQSLSAWLKKQPKTSYTNSVYLFVDEFTETFDVEIGKKTVALLQSLDYNVYPVRGLNSGRSYISKGLLKEAKKHAQKNIEFLSRLMTDTTPLIGIEPSSILTFRDEAIDLLRGEEKEKAQKVAENCFTIEEFIAQEIKNGNINQSQFEPLNKKVHLHGHCQQKAMIGNQPILDCLSVIPNNDITEIPSGCCGMAGSFGYEKEHYDVSMKIGELVLFPAVRNAAKEEIIVAPGTSCRHQIVDGTGKKAIHPVELLWQQVKK